MGEENTFGSPLESDITTFLNVCYIQCRHARSANDRIATCRQEPFCMFLKRKKSIFNAKIFNERVFFINKCIGTCPLQYDSCMSSKVSSPEKGMNEDVNHSP